MCLSKGKKLKMKQEIKELQRICRKLTILHYQSGPRLFYGLEQLLIQRFLNALVHIISCLAATTLAQPKVNMGKIVTPDSVETIPCSS